MNRKDTSLKDRAAAFIDTESLVRNYHTLQEFTDQAMLPMIKANAYGHGLAWAAQVLMRLPHLYALGVATLSEGVEARQSIGARGRKTRIIVFSETGPWSDAKGELCEEYGLTPVIASESDWNVFSKSKWAEKISYELQFNTGMNRLGIEPSFLPTLIKAFKKKPHNEHPTGVFSHFAVSESYENKHSRAQLELFKKIRNDLDSVIPGARYHFANSGGIWNHKEFGLKDLTDVVRPGLALYGIPPWAGAPRRGILPVMEFKAQVTAVHKMNPGDFIGYGATYIVQGKDPVYAAILTAGYADGVIRALGNRGSVYLDGNRVPFLGVVSMDLCAVQCTASTRVGAMAEILGSHADPWALAQSCGTIPYEVLTSISSRVKRVYDSKS